MVVVATTNRQIVRIHDDGKVDNLLLPMVIEQKKDVKAIRREKVTQIAKKVTETVGLVSTKVYSRYSGEFLTYEITPTPSVKNNQAYILAKIVAGFYRKPNELRSWGLPWKDGLIRDETQYRLNFRIVMKHNDIAFYLLVPKDKASEILRKAEAIYDSKITIKQVEPLPDLDPSKMFCSELKYKKHDIFSLATDKNDNYPLPSLLGTVRTLEEGDVAVFDAMIEPYDHMKWDREAKEAHNQLEKGYIPNASSTSKILRMVSEMFNFARKELLEATRFTPAQKEAMKRWKVEEGQFREAEFIQKHMHDWSSKKRHHEVVKTYLRIAVQSDDEKRAQNAAYTMADAYKDLTLDNELMRVDIPKKWTARYWKAMRERKGFYMSFAPPKMSVDEAGKMLQLPANTLIEEFPQIRHKNRREVALPDELNLENVKGIRVGWVTERDMRKLAKIPLEEYTVTDSNGYKKVEKKKVYDALCMTTFAQGKQGSGKSEGYGSVTAYDMVMAGFTVIIIDTADGDMLRKFVNCLPEDFPEEKIHALNLDNKAYPIPLDWADVYGRKFNAAEGDEELQALEIRERLTSRFIGFVNSLKGSGETFTDRMSQYLNSCMRAVTTQKSWSFLDVELCLTSPSYREELLNSEKVKEMPEVVRDLESLQVASVNGKDRAIIDPILSRIKELSSSQLMTNLFFQEPKLDDNGKPVLDFRRIMDNPEGGYGHVVVIQASYYAWQEYQSLILGFVEDKINFNAFSRIDVDQSERKPVLKWIDEPHKVIDAIEGRLAGTSVEFRKYRVKNLFTGHSIDQMGKAANAMLDGGANITSYKTERESELKRFSHMFEPYDDHKELYKALPDSHVAINKVRLGSGRDCPAFIAEMVAPPKFVKDRGHVWEQSAKRYGRHWKEVTESIRGKRDRYAEMDVEWVSERKEELNRQKKEERQLAKMK